MILKASDKVSDSIIVFLTPEEVSMIDGEWKLYLTKIKHDILKLEELIKKYPEEIKKYPKEIKKFLDKKGINMPKSTRKICKRNGKAEKILQKIEDILSKNGMQLGFDDSSLIIKSDDFIYKSTDLENGDNTSCLPREMDSERLVLIEENDYI